MTPRARIRNTDYTICRECGTASNMTPCPVCTEREMKAAQSKRVVMVQHADGTTVADPTWLTEQHAATAAAVVAAIERHAWPQNQAVTVDEAAPMAEKMIEAWHEHLAGMSDEEIKRLEAMEQAEQSGRDWQHLRGDCDL